VLRIVRKGGKASTEPLAPIVLHALEAYVGERTGGPIFLNSDATARLSYSIAYKLIRRLAKRAAIAGAARISPHSLRHSFACERARAPARSRSAPLRTWRAPAAVTPRTTQPPR
jgi:integrase/recombinase XerD